ncbi:NADP-dependent oxidoreductase [Ramlibacter sp. WS9]|uniref:NADP-dependent oxidoreductase n=1 Tax=Ramlibacter sp. WS9 TaxID=1882741 RepID=UPI00114230CC|nr:NADP-dependent oxidoreductase [Ramlibacter sp. WS9]ROZ79393.1 NADP-dependent oxidoreductase [Ramlibacter sp. WS9]
MSLEVNLQVRLAKRPDGLPDDDCWSIVEHFVPEVGNGQFVVRNEFISIDPAMRGWVSAGDSYIAPVAIGEVMRARAVGEIVGSRHAAFPVGTKVMGFFGVQNFGLSNGQAVTRIDEALAPMPQHLAALGSPGMTAYFGLLHVGACQAGETVVVSAASGAVGQIVAQIARLKGCTVIGIAGGSDKCRFVVEQLGAQACIDYKSVNVASDLRSLCPQGIDVFFDNVGGDILDAALANLAQHARVVICGAISQYNNLDSVKGPKNYLSLISKRASMRGMLVTDFADRNAIAVSELAGWLRDGLVRSTLDVEAGLTRFPSALRKLFAGANFGKLVIEV